MAGEVHRWRGRWYATGVGERAETDHPTRVAAAEALQAAIAREVANRNSDEGWTRELQPRRSGRPGGRTGREADRVRAAASGLVAGCDTLPAAGADALTLF